MKRQFKIIAYLYLILFLFPSMVVNATPSVNEDGDNYVAAGEDGDAITQDVEVTVSKGASFKVCVPKRIEIVPNTTTVYKVGVYGDISSTQKIVVEPIDTTGDGDEVVNFILENTVNEGITAKPSVKATITPIKTEWFFGDTDLIADKNEVSNPTYHVDAGSIDADLTAGQWSGVFTLRISLQ